MMANGMKALCKAKESLHILQVKFTKENSLMTNPLATENSPKTVVRYTKVSGSLTNLMEKESRCFKTVLNMSVISRTA